MCRNALGSGSNSTISRRTRSDWMLPSFNGLTWSCLPSAVRKTSRSATQACSPYMTRLDPRPLGPAAIQGKVGGPWPSTRNFALAQDGFGLAWRLADGGEDERREPPSDQRQGQRRNKA